MNRVIVLSERRREQDRLRVAADLERIAGHLRRGESVAEPVAFVLALHVGSGVEDARTEVLFAGLDTASLPMVRDAITASLNCARTL